MRQILVTSMEAFLKKETRKDMLPKKNIYIWPLQNFSIGSYHLIELSGVKIYEEY